MSFWCQIKLRETGLFWDLILNFPFLWEHVLRQNLKICATLIKLTFLDLQKGAQAFLLKEAFLNQQCNSRPSCNYDGVKQEKSNKLNYVTFGLKINHSPCFLLPYLITRPYTKQIQWSHFWINQNMEHLNQFYSVKIFRNISCLHLLDLHINWYLELLSSIATYNPSSLT